MSEFDPNIENEQQEVQEEKPSFTPAGFEKRATAWMGIVYMLFLLFIVTFAIFTGGKNLPGTFPIFLAPVAVTAAVITVYRYCKGQAMYNGTLVTTILIVIICVAVAAFGLVLGVPPLVDAIRAAAVR